MSIEIRALFLFLLEMFVDFEIRNVCIIQTIVRHRQKKGKTFCINQERH